MHTTSKNKYNIFSKVDKQITKCISASFCAQMRVSLHPLLGFVFFVFFLVLWAHGFSIGGLCMYTCVVLCVCMLAAGTPKFLS